jgi:hypothetical protein
MPSIIAQHGDRICLILSGGFSDASTAALSPALCCARPLAARREFVRGDRGRERGSSRMSLEGILIGLLGVVLGTAFCFAGYRYFLLLLPIWGLFVGFMAGWQATATLLGESLFASTIGLVVGIVLAIVFAVLSYLYWWGAVAVIAGTLGFWVTQWAIGLLGISTDGLIITLLSIAVGVVVGFVALVINAPKYVAIILTAFAGAAWISVGIALAVGIIKPETLEGGALVAVYTQGWLWIAIWGVAAAAGIIAQLAMTGRMERDLVAQMDARRPY